MKLWGKALSGVMFVMAAAFASIAIAVPETRSESVGAVVLLVVAALFGVPALVRLFMSFTGDEEVLKNGAAASAAIVSLTPTGWRYNRFYPIIHMTLNMEQGGVVYPVEMMQAVEPELFERLSPGVVVGGRVDRSDRKKVVIDTRQPIRAAVMGSTVKQ